MRPHIHVLLSVSNRFRPDNGEREDTNSRSLGRSLGVVRLNQFERPRDPSLVPAKNQPEHF